MDWSWKRSWVTLVAGYRGRGEEFLGSGNHKKMLDVTSVDIQCAERREISGARRPLGDQILSRAPGEFRASVLHCDDIRDHPRVPTVSVREGGDFRNEFVVEAKNAFIDGKDLVVDPVLRIGKELWDSLEDLAGIASDVQPILAVRSRPFPNFVEHLAVESSDVRLVQGIHGFHGAAVESPLSGLHDVQRFVFVQFRHGADSGNQRFRFLGANGSIPVRELGIEDEVHRVFLRLSLRCASSSISWFAFSGFWSSSIIVCITLSTSLLVRSRVGCSASSVNEPALGTSAYFISQPMASATRRSA